MSLGHVDTDGDGVTLGLVHADADADDDQVAASDLLGAEETETESVIV